LLHPVTKEETFNNAHTLRSSMTEAEKVLMSFNPKKKFLKKSLNILQPKQSLTPLLLEEKG
jgi:hypothetical protein